MTGEKYLSELVDFEKLRVDAVNIIKSPTGSGKTYFALHALPEHCIDTYYKSLYLIDTINGKEQILRNYNTFPARRDWINEVQQGGCAWESKDERVVIMTYALLGCILIDDPNFCENFTYIICDELHKLIDFKGYHKNPNQPNLCLYAKKGLERAVKNNTTTVIALTATPKKVLLYFEANCFVPLIDQTLLRQYETKKIIHFLSLKNLIKELNINETGICYTGQVRTMLEFSKLAAAAGLKPICIWSLRCENHTMDEEQLRVRDVILKECKIPSEYNFLIINASCETSIKIKSKVDYVIVNHTNEDIQTQVRGRVDHDLDTLYLRADASKTSSIMQIPEEFLGKELYSKDKEALCQYLDLRRSGKLVKWNSIKTIIQESDSYNIIEKRKNNLRYAIITKADNS